MFLTFFQDYASLPMLDLIKFHDFIMFFIVWLLIFVLFLLYETYNNENSFLNNSWSTQSDYTLEIIWTIFPIIVLIFIAFPSFSILYNLDESFNDYTTVVNVEGRQWYWVYSLFSKFGYDIEEYDSYGEYLTDDTITSDLIELNNLDILYMYNVDQPIILPANENIRLLVSSDDVIHCWSIPSLGIKLDACPGRINQIFFNIVRPGVYFGQCSELCGLGHGLMPIELHSLMNS